jgi:putative ABC transport system permease protein
MILRHLPHSLRSLRRTPGLAGLSMLTIALGVAAATTMAAVVKAVLLNPLPYPEPDRVVWIASRTGGQEIRTSMPDFDDWQKQNHTLSSLALYSDAPLIAGGGETPQHVTGAIVSEQFFDVLGVQPALGRVFIPEEHGPKATLASVIISEGLWRRAYGGDPGIIGRKVSLLGLPSTVIGVMPPGFSFPAGSDLWVSARALPDGNVRTAHNYWVIGRLRPGVGAEAARDEMAGIARALKQQFPGPYQTEDATARTLASHLVGSVRAPLLLLLGAVGLLLIIVCANVANLLLVGGMARSRELAVRTAMGAGRRDLFGQLFGESLMVALAGGAAGFLLAYWSMDLVRVLLPASLPRGAEMAIDGGVTAFTVALSVGAGALFGTLPAWRASRADVHEILRGASRGLTPGPRSTRLQGALVVSEVAVSLVLLAGAGLLIESFERLRAVDAGFSVGGVVTASLSFPMGPAEVPQLAARYRDLLARVRALPGVEHAGTIKDLPLDPIQRSGNFFIERRPRDQALDAGYLVVTPGMMEALAIPVLRGRGFTESDSRTAPAAVVINAEMARRYWPGGDPIGDRIWFNSFEPKERWLTIVGVAGDVRQRGLIEPVPPLAYINFEQAQIQAQLGSGVLIVKTHTDSGASIPAIRAALAAVHPQAAATFRTMDEVMAAATAKQRFQMQMLAAFAGLALLLAAVGVYGVLSFAVTSARAAIGIRMALGAGRWRIFRGVAGRALALTAAGSAIGLAGCVALRGVLSPVVFGIGPSDPMVLSLSAGLMLAVSLAACWVPARRAMRTDPVAALREE